MNILMIKTKEGFKYFDNLCLLDEGDMSNIVELDGVGKCVTSTLTYSKDSEVNKPERTIFVNDIIDLITSDIRYSLSEIYEELNKRYVLLEEKRYTIHSTDTDRDLESTLLLNHCIDHVEAVILIDNIAFTGYESIVSDYGLGIGRVDIPSMEEHEDEVVLLSEDIVKLKKDYMRYINRHMSNNSMSEVTYVDDVIKVKY